MYNKVYKYKKSVLGNSNQGEMWSFIIYMTSCLIKLKIIKMVGI